MTEHDQKYIIKLATKLGVNAEKQSSGSDRGVNFSNKVVCYSYNQAFYTLLILKYKKIAFVMREYNKIMEIMKHMRYNEEYHELSI